MSKFAFVLLASLGFLSVIPSSNADDNIDHFYENFEKEMSLMQKNMNEMFEHHKSFMKKISNPNKSSNSFTSVTRKEDDNFFYYELKFTKFDKDEVIVGIENDTLTFSGVNKEKEKKKTQEISFYYSFSIPSFDKSVKPEIKREKDKIMVKLKKKDLNARS